MTTARIRNKVEMSRNMFSIGKSSSITDAASGFRPLEKAYPFLGFFFFFLGSSTSKNKPHQKSIITICTKNFYVYERYCGKVWATIVVHGKSKSY